jgi:hypothetical protein
MITSAGNRNPANADRGGDQQRDRAACFTDQARVDLPISQRIRARSANNMLAREFDVVLHESGVHILRRFPIAISRRVLVIEFARG